MYWHELETFSFGDNPALANELAALVLEGRKRATCWAACEGLLTTVGKRMVMPDGSGRPRAVLETVELNQCHFDDVDEQFAFDEGEGPRPAQCLAAASPRPLPGTLPSWQRPGPGRAG
jgi:uncharacterized protein YhfF